MTIRLTFAAAALAAMTALPAAANAPVTKEEACGYEAQVMAAVQKARLDKVAQDKVAEHLVASSHAWPEQYNAAIPGMVDYIYQMKRRDLKANDFGAIWNQQCIDMWDQRQQMIKQLNN
ncbi:hypothetical protein [Pseudodonghicola xiamenensis]|uniref:HdeA/HdeB family protein n=1 Tax=Pseudodonghicola xiamenensis TaxID=337702 RepID=A0A8J3MDG4_9RHOB|nr:hypothetical protein [Pseudodonghicola xiamenensis]GHG90389.1 hypothetical protein GCM10010961_20640 [Pseudodonghicola xiamenensis]